MKGVNIFQLQCLLLCFMIIYRAHRSTAKVANREVLTVVLLSKERLLGCDAVAVGERFIMF